MTVTEDFEPFWSKDASYELKAYKWISWPFGLWPFPPRDIFSTFRATFAMIIQISAIIPLMLEISKDCSTTDEKIDFLANLFCNVICLVKILILKINNDKFRYNIFSAIKDWSNEQSENSYNIMISHAHVGVKVCRAQMFFVYFVLFVAVFTNFPLLLAKIRDPDNSNFTQAAIPLPLNCVYNNISLSTSKIMYVIQSVQLIWTGVGNCGIDIIFFGLAMHACGQLQILRKDFSEFGSGNEVSQIRDKLKDLVKRHLQLIDISQYFEDVFNKILMALMVLNCLTIVLLGVQIMYGIKTGDIILLPKVVMAFMVLMVQIYIYCYAGDYLSSLNESLSDGIYNCEWYNHPEDIGKDILLVMLRTKVRFHITAGKLYIMDIENFKNIFKAYVSYISVLLVMVDLDA